LEFIKSKAFNKLFPLTLVLVVSVFAIIPLLKPGFFPVHDNTQVQRVYEMRESLVQGIFPVRWVNDLGYGYGYPIFNYYAPLPYYFGGVANLLGLDPLAATKLMFIFPILLSGLSMYFLGKELWGKQGGFLSAIFYVLAPYHALNIYVRGDIGEIWAYSFFPLVSLSLYKIYKNKNWGYVGLGGIAYALVIISHNLSAFILTPFMALAALLISYSFIKNKQIREIPKLIMVFILGLLLAAFYFIPALVELKYTNVASIIGGGSDFRNHFVCLNQLWSSPWGFGGSNPGCVDGISFKIGKIHILLTALSLIFVGWAYLKKRKIEWLPAFLFFGLFASIFMMLEISKPVWIIFKSMEFIQFPWRYLSLVSFFASLIVGSLTLFLANFIKDKNMRLVLIGFFVLVLIFSSKKIFEPQRVINEKAASYVTPSMLRWTTSKISDEYMPQEFIKPQNASQVPSSVSPGLPGPVISDNAKLKEIAVSMPEGKQVVFNLAYFPAWKGFIDYKEVPIQKREGKVSVHVPKGLHLIELKYESTNTEKNSETLSVVGIFALAVVIILNRLERKNEKKA
jgi:uncharacterized membrane protein